MGTIVKVIAGFAAAIVGVAVFAGLALAMFCGLFFKHTEVTTVLQDYSATAENVTSIALEVDAADFKIREGEEFAIEAKNVPEGCFTSEVVDGTWKIKCEYIVTQKTYVKIFNWEIPIRTGRGSYNGEDCPSIALTVPKDFYAEDINVKLGAGQLVAKTMNAKNAAFNIGAGKMSIDELSISESSSLIVGAGEIVVNDIKATALSCDCGVGNVELTGSILGKSYVKCGIGRVKLNLNAKESDYLYNVKCGVGKVRIGNQNTVSSYDDEFGNSSSADSFTLDCGIGSIEMDFIAQ